MTRIIECQVTDEYVRGSGVVVGAAGSHNDVALRLAFNPMWAGTARSIVWKDALGGNPIITVLGTNLLVPGETEVYIVPIPAEPKAYAGDMSMTIKGAAVDGDKESAATLTARAFFTVMESDWDENAEEAQDITPTQAAQFQAQLEAIKDDISEAAKAVEETTAIKEAAEQHAADAAESAQAAEKSASDAMNAVDKNPKINEKGTWMLWDVTSGTYIDTGIKAQGTSGVYVGSGPMPDGCNVQVDYENGDDALDFYALAEETMIAAGVATESAGEAKESEKAAKEAQTAAEQAAREAQAAAGGDFADRIHAHQHAVGGSDPITPAMIGAVSREEWQASLMAPATVE